VRVENPPKSVGFGGVLWSWRDSKLSATQLIISLFQAIKDDSYDYGMDYNDRYYYQISYI
jgi:hypothetical protein